MGRRGPAPTPTRLRVLRGETRPSQVNLAEPVPIQGLPVPPADLGPDALAVWVRILAAFGHTGVITGADTDTLRLYCEAMVRYQQAARLLDQSGPLSRGRRGAELVKNPLHQVVRDTATLVRALAGDLGLTPAARVGLRYAGTAPNPHGRLAELRERRVTRLNRTARA